ncbi:hypothetical protein PS15m_001147 [Mucor circinelloides]
MLISFTLLVLHQQHKYNVWLACIKSNTAGVMSWIYYITISVQAFCIVLASYEEGIRSVYFIISLNISNNILYVSYKDHFYREMEDFVVSNFDSIYKRDWF